MSNRLDDMEQRYNVEREELEERQKMAPTLPNASFVDRGALIRFAREVEEIINNGHTWQSGHVYEIELALGRLKEES